MEHSSHIKIKTPFIARCISMHLKPALISDMPVVSEQRFVDIKVEKIKISEFGFVRCETPNILVTLSMCRI